MCPDPPANRSAVSGFTMVTDPRKIQWARQCRPTRSIDESEVHRTVWRHVSDALTAAQMRARRACWRRWLLDHAMVLAGAIGRRTRGIRPLLRRCRQGSNCEKARKNQAKAHKLYPPGFDQSPASVNDSPPQLFWNRTLCQLQGYSAASRSPRSPSTTTNPSRRLRPWQRAANCMGTFTFDVPCKTRLATKPSP